MFWSKIPSSGFLSISRVMEGKTGSWPKEVGRVIIIHNTGAKEISTENYLPYYLFMWWVESSESVSMFPIPQMFYFTEFEPLKHQSCQNSPPPAVIGDLLMPTMPTDSGTSLVLVTVADQELLNSSD